MKKPLATLLMYLCLLTPALSCADAPAKGAALPDEWVDRDTGHKVVRLSRREGNNESLYFHQNPFTAEGDKMVFLGSTDKGRNAFTVDLRTREIRQITHDRNVGFEAIAPKRRELFYLSGDTVYATHLDSAATREIAKVPAFYGYGRGFTINADETLLAACYAKGEQEYYGKMPYKEWVPKIFEAKLPNALYTINIATGEINEFYRDNQWLGHVQFSPTDPSLVEFCHEGPGREVDRMWLIRTDGTGLRKLYTKKYPHELQTHEFWDPSGDAIWVDFQTPRLATRILPFLSPIIDFNKYLARFDVKSGDFKKYPLKERHVCWHYNISKDGTLLCGDGEARWFRLCRSGKWIFLFRPEGEKLHVEPLCSMRNHSYKIAPNSHITPDNQWVVFQSDMSGILQVYAVEIRGPK